MANPAVKTEMTAFLCKHKLILISAVRVPKIRVAATISQLWKFVKAPLGHCVYLIITSKNLSPALLPLTSFDTDHPKVITNHYFWEDEMLIYPEVNMMKSARKVTLANSLHSTLRQCKFANCFDTNPHFFHQWRMKWPRRRILKEPLFLR